MYTFLIVMVFMVLSATCLTTGGQRYLYRVAVTPKPYDTISIQGIDGK